MGMIRMATTREASREKATVKACSLNSSPEAPRRYTMGINTTMVVSVEAMMAPPTWEVPLIGSFTRIVALFVIPENILQHHNGIVHQHSGPQCQSARGS